MPYNVWKKKSHKITPKNQKITLFDEKENFKKIFSSSYLQICWKPRRRTSGMLRTPSRCTWVSTTCSRRVIGWPFLESLWAPRASSTGPPTTESCSPTAMMSTRTAELSAPSREPTDSTTSSATLDSPTFASYRLVVDFRVFNGCIKFLFFVVFRLKSIEKKCKKEIYFDESYKQK